MGSLLFLTGKVIEDSHMSEAILQIQIVDWFKLQYGNTGIIHHSPNENPSGLNKVQAINYNKKLASMGRITGFPDLMIMRKDGRVMFIELKYGRNILTQTQALTAANLRSCNFKYHLVNNFDSACMVIDRFMA
jgi:hypothetical protein